MTPAPKVYSDLPIIYGYIYAIYLPTLQSITRSGAVSPSCGSKEGRRV